MISIIFLSSFSAIAQCAGTGSEITICDKETDPSLQAYNLFDLLSGETPGGTWVSESNFNSNALNTTTGELNLWSINRFGAHQFTYRNSACDSSKATVTIHLGGYPGESNQNPGRNNVCQVLKTDDDDDANIIDLFIFIDTVNVLVEPDTGGTWTEDPGNIANGVLSGEFFNFGEVPIGTYTFTYTVPEVNGCASSSATIDVEVRRSPSPGAPIDLLLCETDDMSGLRDLNLFSRLLNADSNGEWQDANLVSTGEITSGTDFEIDVENIYNNFGPGIYKFSYRVLPEHPICEEQTSVFTLCIEKQLVLHGNLDVACTGDVVINYDSSLLSNGTYNLAYTVSGNSLGTQNNIKGVDFVNGRADFSLYPELSLVASEQLTIVLNDITLIKPPCGFGLLCASEIVVPSKAFDMFLDPPISVSSTTGCELDDVLITYLDAVDSNFVPLEGVHNVSYAINAVNYTDEVTFSNGNGIAHVSGNRFMLGDNQLVFYNTNSFVHCNPINVLFSLNIPAPENPVFSIVPDNICDASSVQFGFNSPPNEFIDYNPVTFDIYQYGSEPQQFAPRNPSVSLINNTQGDGIDINISNANDVSLLPDGDYVFVIHSEQNDNALCRGLSQAELDNYAAQGIDIGLTKMGTTHIFDARLIFRIGTPEPTKLIKNNFEFCLLNGPVTLGDLSISAGSDVDIVITDLNDVVLADTYELTGDETFKALMKSTITGCDLGTEDITVSETTNASSLVLQANVFCNLVTHTVSDLDTSDQDIIWYDSETGGVAYNTSDVIDATNSYWAEITIPGGCVSASRTAAEITFVDQSVTPTPLSNQFCASATPTISDLAVETEVDAMLEWFTSETGPEYTSTALALDETKEYWVTQSTSEGCESARVQVVFTISNVAPNPEPLTNTFCTAGGSVYTLEDLTFEASSIYREGVLSYFSDASGTNVLASTELLKNVSSPVYVQQIIGGTCASDIIAVNFSLQDSASKPVISAVTFCSESNPTVQNLVDVLETQTSSTILIYEDETIATPMDGTIELSSISGNLYASQAVIRGCESVERTLVNYTLIAPTLSISDFKQLHCSSSSPTLNDVYLGGEIVLWFDENNNPLSGTESLQDGVSYFSMIEVDSCLSPMLEVVIALVDVETPVPNSEIIEFCGIEEKVISDLAEDDSGNMSFTIPENHTLVWYDSDDVSTRNRLDNDTVLENGVYYAVYELNASFSEESIICESSATPITVDLTICDPSELVIPDAFSPNGDRINDTFELKNIEFVYPDYKIEIYNRYGRVVFKGDIEVGFWDGESNQSGFLSGKVLPSGVYFYVINFNRFDTKPYQGQVYLKL
ncbi:gliding motility-associated C-terminal domain-containing protein [Tamlana sp. 2_MG-2023]|uniref:gliding motility-associated C-terminal domain-containing protein n=1 Tax=unclassified Tamlana TaxID=2614803 RepID=UPI0026E3E435|nr:MULTISPECIES: gliding motility-associated C-terminal domain-containing protein [unclassified Tamlana]MDO6758852.1 gliding motility-associated C-terminal domain-containing protein [Tamlana sp. 2_MG-2023]MDO6789551.1 gliding motility-associated C-terminal domain-containing protein [Tamlana sp. 1_MG-2023]